VRRALREAEEHRHRLRAETTLNRHEKLFRALSENALDIVTILDREGTSFTTAFQSRGCWANDPAELNDRSRLQPHGADRCARAWLAALQSVVAQPEIT